MGTFPAISTSNALIISEADCSTFSRNLTLSYPLGLLEKTGAAWQESGIPACLRPADRMAKSWVFCSGKPPSEPGIGKNLGFLVLPAFQGYRKPGLLPRGWLLGPEATGIRFSCHGIRPNPGSKHSGTLDTSAGDAQTITAAAAGARQRSSPFRESARLAKVRV